MEKKQTTLGHKGVKKRKGGTIAALPASRKKGKGKRTFPVKGIGPFKGPFGKKEGRAAGTLLGPEGEERGRVSIAARGKSRRMMKLLSQALGSRKGGATRRGHALDAAGKGGGRKACT